MAILTITPINDALPLAGVRGLQERIQQSSNFRFAWQFFRTDHGQVVSAGHARRILDTVIAEPGCHHFLRHSFDDMYDPAFAISPLHEHASVVAADNDFPGVVAAAAGDHLGAYSHHLREATPSEAAHVRSIFEGAGSYRAFQLLPGNHAGCARCRHHNNHLFSSWFFGVAWDWCFVLSWPESRLTWVGCLTDTD